MNAEMVRLGLHVTVTLKGIFAVCALIGVIYAARDYKRLSGTQKYYFWIATPLTVVALLWVASMTLLLTHPYVAPMIPQAGWYFIIFASPTAAIAAGATMGVMITAQKSVPKVINARNPQN